MDKAKREARKLAKQQAKLAELLGLTTPEPSTVTLPKQLAEDASREAEAALAYYDDPSLFTRRECKQCKGAFAVNRANVAYCSDSCRKASLHEIGVTWDTTKRPADRWKMNWQSVKVYEPLVVPGHVADMMDAVKTPAPEDTSLQEQVATACSTACSEMHTYESGCEYYFLDNVV